MLICTLPNAYIEPIIQLYPNPIYEHLTIKNEYYNNITVFKIYDLIGNELITGEFFHETTIDFFGMAIGTYIVKVMSGDSVSYHKVVKI